MKHTMPSPFPWATPKGTIIDELCYCGKKRSEHMDTLAYGHGAAPGCAKFTWKKHILAKEAR